MKIELYRFDDAPAELQALSINGGDEDWLAVIPAAMWEEWNALVDEGCHAEVDDVYPIPFDVRRFGCSSVDVHRHGDNYILIGAHA